MLCYLRLSAVLSLLCVFLLGSGNTYAQQKTFKRIVSLNGTVTEILCDLGFEKEIAGVDVTSTYPAAMQRVPKVGHNRNISAEPVFRPDWFAGPFTAPRTTLWCEKRIGRAEKLHRAAISGGC